MANRKAQVHLSDRRVLEEGEGTGAGRAGVCLAVVDTVDPAMAKRTPVVPQRLFRAPKKAVFSFCPCSHGTRLALKLPGARTP